MFLLLWPLLSAVWIALNDSRSVRHNTKEQQEIKEQSACAEASSQHLEVSKSI